jgi:transcriptional regulator with PAS, ATPase and Fis domain
MKQVMQLVERIAVEDVTCVILGESGTGKEVVARTIHQLSPRAAGPFVAINCGAIPQDLIEAEIFGAERGAYTGADRRRLGRLELAQGGTFFLDEVGELPPALQVKLLRVLESRRFERIGGEESVRWNARVIAATNRDLEAEVLPGGAEHGSPCGMMFIR